MRRVCTAALMLVLCLSMVPLNSRSADASDRRRNVVVGGGIIGAIIVNELTSRRYEERRVSRSRQSTSRKKTANQGKATNQQAAAKRTPAKSADAASAKAPQVESAAVAPTRSQAVAAISAPEEITSAQEHLRYMGYDVPQASGVVDLKTKIAIMQFQDSIGAPTTGMLTVEQLQALFLRAAERHAKSQ